jgi:hypothetical protein
LADSDIPVVAQFVHLPGRPKYIPLETS